MIRIDLQQMPAGYKLGIFLRGEVSQSTLQVQSQHFLLKSQQLLVIARVKFYHGED